MRHERRFARVVGLLIFGLLLFFLWPQREPRTIKVASAKGRVIAAQMKSLSPLDQSLLAAAKQDDALGAILRAKRTQLLRTESLGIKASAEIPNCGDCRLLTFYNYSDGGVIKAVYNIQTNSFISNWFVPEARPNASGYLVKQVVTVAADDPRVTDVLGDLRKAKVAMVPMSTWLADNDCARDWCVDLTFHDPAGSGKIFHIIVNLHQEVVARTFFTRGLDERAALQADELDENAPAFTDGCYEQHGWSICWEMTPHDGLNIYDARFNDTLIFSSAKIAQVEAYYPSWPGGYRDELGFASTVPPKFDTRITDFEDGFELRQLFTEPFNWPNCICCYRYEQIIEFGQDGSFSPTFISHGPGCDELAEYRPFWRFNIDLNGSKNNEVWYWDDREWVQVVEEEEINVFKSLSLDGEKLAISDEGVNYRWEPERSDPLALDEARLFIVNSEGEQEIEPGPADTYDPARSYVNAESLTSEDADIAIWYIPVLKTIRGGPWWCATDPEPDFSPCFTTMRVNPAGKLVQPSEAELALRDAQTKTPVASTVAPLPTDDNLLAVYPPTPRAVEGVMVEEVILNAGCGACHEIGELGEAGKVGPSLNNIGNTAQLRVPGQPAKEYLYNSIIYPNIFIAPECPNGECLSNVMPGTYHLTLSDQQVSTLVNYMLTLTDDGAESITTVPETAHLDENKLIENESSRIEAGQTNVPIYLFIVSSGTVLLSGAALILWIGRRKRR